MIENVRIVRSYPRKETSPLLSGPGVILVLEMGFPSDMVETMVRCRSAAGNPSRDQGLTGWYGFSSRRHRWLGKIQRTGVSVHSDVNVSALACAQQC